MIKIDNNLLIKSIEQEYLKLSLVPIKIGDNINLGVKIFEGNKERIQFYEGIVIAKKNSSVNETITVRKTFQNVGVERIFLVHSPKIAAMKILRSAKVRRAKLYYMRKLKGKATRLRQFLG